MAIYHLSGKVISRSQGRSSVAAAAYRAAEKLKDERTGITHNFTKKESDIIHKEILAPSNTPEHLTEREQLWNVVEAKENRKDAQLAREFNIALPRELTEQQNIELARVFVQKEFVDNGMIADLCLHRGHKSSEDQPHIHVMLTMREVTEDGFGLKNRDWNSKELLQHWREAWSEHCNLALAKHGHDMQIDHRTLEAQGIDLEPQTKIGPKDAGSRMVRFEEHRQIARENGERLIANPEVVLDALTRQQSTFTHRDIARVVNRYTDGAEQFNQVYSTVKTHPSLEYLGQDDNNAQRFTTTEMLALETKMLSQAKILQQNNNHEMPQKYLDKASKSKQLSSEQKTALQHITTSNSLACVVGFAGTGKSYMLGAAKDAWQKQGYNILGMTLSGIAAESLEAGSGISSRTVASHIWHWDRNLESLNSKDIVVVDEAGMLGSRQMARIVDMASNSGAKLVLIGDTEQLQAIEAGAAFRAIAEQSGVATMTEVQRQREAWQQQATKDFANGNSMDALQAYIQRDNVHSFEDKAATMQGMLEQWYEVCSNNPETSQLMLAYTRADVMTLNDKARQMRIENGELLEQQQLSTAKGNKDFAVNDKIYFLQNDRKLGVKNGTLGIIDAIDNDRLTVHINDSKNYEQKLSFSINDYNNIDYGYAATIHKAQGVTVDRTHLLASSYLDKHASYVAMSRHRDSADLYFSKEAFPDISKLANAMSNTSYKDISLDYALQRGFEAEPSYNGSQMQSAEERINQRLEEKAEQVRLEQEIQLAQIKEQELYNTLDNINDYTKEHGDKYERFSELWWDVRSRHGISLFDPNELKLGDIGIYRGTIDIGAQRYGLLQQEESRYKLIPEECIEANRKGEFMRIVARDDNIDRDNYKLNELRTEQPEQERQIKPEEAMAMVRAQEIALSREKDMGLSL